ncbi:ribosome silencing factor [Polaromonas sp.]|uniref:ribosome silencing factor n=1 Tax=Polaromonas sp. TaxID=1869339 RepID=UPI002FC75573
MTNTTASIAAKKDVQKLQRAIIDGLEDVKAQDIQVFDTEHITSLFERVILASGTSNRQTKALAASVRDAVRDAGFAKPRIEGEANGEWIIVDCGAAVAHIMQPTIRQYYNLEELWGDKPIKLKLGAPAPLVKAAAAKPAGKTPAKPAAKAVKAAAKPGVKEAKAPARKAAAKTAKAAAPGRAAPKTTPKAPAKVAAKKTAKAAAPASATAKKPAAKKAAPKKTVAARKTATRRA